MFRRLKRIRDIDGKTAYEYRINSRSRAIMHQTEPNRVLMHFRILDSARDRRHEDLRSPRYILEYDPRDVQGMSLFDWAVLKAKSLYKQEIDSERLRDRIAGMKSDLVQSNLFDKRLRDIFNRESISYSESDIEDVKSWLSRQKKTFPDPEMVKKSLRGGKGYEGVKQYYWSLHALYQTYLDFMKAESPSKGEGQE